MSKTRAFTLIELLVVISIIALLIAILLPALASARYSAIVTQCKSNNKQLAIAATSYATDFKGEFVKRDATTSKYVGGYRHGGGDLWSKPFLDYMNGAFEDVPEVVLCPNSNNKGDTWGEGARANWRLSDYAYWPTYFERITEGANSNISYWAALDEHGDPIKTPADLDAASDSPLFGDALYESGGWRMSAHPEGNGQGYSAFVDIANGGSAQMGSEPAGGNQANLDGSVQWSDFDDFDEAAMRFLGGTSKQWWVTPK